MYMNLKPNQHKRISFNTTTMTSLGFIAPPKILGPCLNLAPPKFNFLLRSLPNYFGLKFLGPPLKFGGGWGAATMLSPEGLLNFLSKFYIPLCVGKIFKFKKFTFLENALIQGNFYSCPSPIKTHHQVLVITP